MPNANTSCPGTDANVSSPDTSVAERNLSQLRRDNPGWDIIQIGPVLYAWPDGQRGEPLRAMTPAKLQDKIRQEPQVPAQRPAR